VDSDYLFGNLVSVFLPGELAHQSLVQTRNGASGAKCEKNINKLSNPTVNEVEADEERQLRFRVRAPHRDRTEAALFDGTLEPLPDPHPYSTRDLVFCKHGEYWTTQYEEAWFQSNARSGMLSLFARQSRP
jgi:hypothetical protein